MDDHGRIAGPVAEVQSMCWVENKPRKKGWQGERGRGLRTGHRKEGIRRGTAGGTVPHESDARADDVRPSCVHTGAHTRSGVCAPGSSCGILFSASSAIWSLQVLVPLECPDSPTAVLHPSRRLSPAPSPSLFYSFRRNNARTRPVVCRLSSGHTSVPPPTSGDSSGSSPMSHHQYDGRIDRVL